MPASQPPGISALTASALWLAAPRTIEFRAESIPPPAAGEVCVQALASGISAGTELLVYRGQVAADLPLDLPTLAGSYAFPIKYGYAAVGRVTDLGPEVSGLAPGDLVFCLHPHQSIFTVPAMLCVRLPPDLDPVLGVFTANVETAVNVLLDTPLKLGETAVVFGLGTVGQLIAQLLRRAGAGRVVGVDPIAFRRTLALTLGADIALTPDAFAADPTYQSADVAIEVSGAPSALQAAIDCVADEGTVVAVSWYGSKPVTLALGGHFHRGRVRLRSSQVGRVDPALAPRWNHARRMATVLDLLPTLPLVKLITHRLPFADAGEGYRLLDQQAENLGQVVLEYGRRPTPRTLPPHPPLPRPRGEIQGS